MLEFLKANFNIIFPVVTAFCSSFMTFWFGRKMLCDKIGVDRRNISVAYFTEIYTLLKVAEKNRFYGRIKDTQELLNNGCSFRDTDYLVRIDSSTNCVVHNANADNIGKLDSEVILEVMEFYNLWNTVVHDLTTQPKELRDKIINRMGEGKESECVYTGRLKELLAYDEELFIKAVDDAKKVCKSLSEKYGLCYDEPLRDVPTWFKRPCC